LQQYSKNRLIQNKPAVHRQRKRKI